MAEKNTDRVKKISSKKVITQFIFVLLLIVVAITAFKQIKPSNNLIDSRVFMALPDRKPIPVVKLKQAERGEVSSEMMKGKWHLLFFGYTFCPDICPVELSTLHKMTDILRDQLPTEQLPQTLFISIDPKRDTPENIAKYVKHFDADFIGVTGDKAELESLAQPLGVSWINEYKKGGTKKTDEKNYLVSHTTTIILVNQNMKVVGLFLPPHSAKKMAEAYKKAIQKEAL